MFRRALASMRWRSGLDADLAALGTRADALELGRTQAEAAKDQLANELRQASESLVAVRDVLARVDAALPAVESRVSVLESGLVERDGALAGTAHRCDELASRAQGESARLDEVAARATRLEGALDGLSHAARPAMVWADIVLHSTWSSLVPLAGAPTVSIVLPTRNRSALVRRAVDSVLQQSYPCWQLVVIDDASTDDTVAVIEAIRDDRITLVRGDGAGVGRARNQGLAAVSGSIITFLDDDNLMAPGWLRAVVVAFQEHPDLQAAYGAQLRAHEPTAASDMSLLFVTPFDWEELLRGNFIDLGVVAHRAGLPQLSFDEDLVRLIDWDYIVRLAGRFGLTPIPVVASLYTTDAPGRISHRGVYERHAEQLRARFRDMFGPPPPVPTSDADAEELPVGIDAAPPETPVPGLSTRGSTKAWMTASDADLLEDILARLAQRFGDELRVLEWGAGLSTLHYPAWLARSGVRVSWLAIEHDRGLFAASVEGRLRDLGATVVRAEELPAAAAGAIPRAAGGVTAVVFDEGTINPFDPNPLRYTERAKDLDAYVSLPARLGIRVHVAIVDGRKRRRCLLEAASLLEPGGVALLHDAQRPYYHPAFAAYRSGRRIGDELWIGALHETDFRDLVPEAALAAPGIEYVPGT